jgi:hypothetical protein
MAPPPEPQVDLLPPEDAHPVPHNEPPIVEKPAAVDDHGKTSLPRYNPPTLPLPAEGPTTTTPGFTRDPQGPLVPEAVATHAATTDNTATIPAGPSPEDAAFPNDSGAHDHNDAGQAGMPEERNLVASQQTVHTSQVTTKTNAKRSRGRDQYKYNVPTPSYTSFSPLRNSSNSSTSTRYLANSQLDPTSNSLLEQTRRIAMKQAKSTAAAAAASTRTERGLGSTNSSSAQQRRKPVPIVNSKSIVGSRYVSFYLLRSFLSF